MGNQKLVNRACGLMLVVVILVGCGGARAEPTDTSVPEPTVVVDEGERLPSLNELDEGWNMLSPGGDTICSNGTDYAFFVRPGDAEKLLIYLQGGGGCWLGENCDPTVTRTYDPLVDETDHPANEDMWRTPGGAGIFDLENPENPFTGYSMVYVPYCTADFHLGNSVVTYAVEATDETEAHDITIHHKGYVNVTAVLEWVFENFQALETIFVCGSSAGAIPSPFYATLVAEQYPDAHIAQLGDAAGGYRSATIPMLFTKWGTLDVLRDFPEYTDVTIDNLTFETFYTVSGSQYPNIAFAQYNTAADAAQLWFLGLLGVTDIPLIELLETNMADINATVDNFRFYTAEGELHGILPRPEFYTYQVDGLRIRDWVKALAAGEEIDDVMCTDCQFAE